MVIAFLWGFEQASQLCVHWIFAWHYIPVAQTLANFKKKQSKKEKCCTLVLLYVVAGIITVTNGALFAYAYYGR